MTTIFDQMVSIRGRRIATTGNIPIPAQVDFLMLKIERPRTGFPVGWDSGAKIRTSIIVTVDGQEYTFGGSATGGIRLDQDGNEMPAYLMRSEPPWGFFGGETTQRLGERSVTSYTARAEIELLSGSFDSRVTLEYTESPAPVVLRR